MLRSVSARNYVRTDMPGTSMRVGFVAQEVQNALPAGFANIVNTAPYGSGAEEREILILDYARLVCPSGSHVAQCLLALKCWKSAWPSFPLHSKTSNGHDCDPDPMLPSRKG